MKDTQYPQNKRKTCPTVKNNHMVLFLAKASKKQNNNKTCFWLVNEVGGEGGPVDADAALQEDDAEDAGEQPEDEYCQARHQQHLPPGRLGPQVGPALPPHHNAAQSTCTPRGLSHAESEFKSQRGQVSNQSRTSSHSAS